MLNLRMYGSDIWFDNHWVLRHLPPHTPSEGTRFRQDIFRWLCRRGTLGRGGIFHPQHARSHERAREDLIRLFTIIPTSVSGAISHIRNRTCLPKLGIAAGLGGACLSPVGVWLAALSPDWCVMGAAALIIGYSAVTMFRKALKAPKGTTAVVA